ncbi:MAG: hypothetical protein MZV70_74845 [Desulfobacterales bacterium]|nr:hypothetical protein [Desulfobacterales bacterium]
MNPIIATMFFVLLGWKTCVVHGAATFMAAIACGVVLKGQFFTAVLARVANLI